MGGCVRDVLVPCDWGSAREQHREAWTVMGHLRLERSESFLQGVSAKSYTGWSLRTRRM